jgi:ATP-dependent DNA helicase DinG
VSDVPATASQLPDVPALLTAAVAAIGGAERSGQVSMARAVARAIETGEHLAVQAGTGTGKSLAYLVPAALHARQQQATVVVSTATIALQRQLIDRDLPRLADAVEPLLGRAPTFAILKGRRNYLCRMRLSGSPADDPQDALFSPAAASEIGRQVARLHQWSATTTSGDRDELVPGVDERAWRQVSVTARECIGAQRCPLAGQCFAERAREQAALADIVVTNHALLAIDAIEGGQVLPEHDVVIIDEAHDLADRVTSVAADELSAPAVDAAARRLGRLATEEATARLRDAGQGLGAALDSTAAGRIDDLAGALAAALAAVRDAAGACAADVRASARGGEDPPEQLTARRAALAALDELHDCAGRMLGAFGADVAARPDVVWLDAPPDRDPGYPLTSQAAAQPASPATLRVAPLDVGGLLAERLFGRRTVMLTSATLSVGGSFAPLARQWGLPAPERSPRPGPATGPRSGPWLHEKAADSPARRSAMTGEEGESGGQAGERDEGHPLAWTGMDVGSPFDHPRSGILYVARHLPPPGRDGLPDAYLDELRELITAAGGRTLGLFSSMRAARQAASQLREWLSFPVLCQGDDPTSQLVARFAADEPTCLFGTLSLWQGVDVPGPSLQLVVIDRIPFPRPDDPLASARQRAVVARGGNGFMSVAAAQAALLLAQGTGRLLRTMTDRGVVAILDPRLVTARYGDFLRASLPPFWTTTNPEVVRGALRRLAAQPDLSATTQSQARSQPGAS